MSSTRPPRAARRPNGATNVQLGLLVLTVTVLPYFLSKLHYRLPTLLPPTSVNGPQVSEESIISHVAALENIGYRTVGTPQARQGEVYVEEQVRALEKRCEADGVLDCDVWIQTGDGFHEFTIMDHDVLKVYKGMTNIILRIRSKNPPSGRAWAKDAVLLNSHIDSTLPAPGAADDGVGVGVMLDVARVLVDRKQPFDNSVIFLWNGGEETLQDGSHLYSTRHETAKEVRTMINLEAAGTTGGALLFQATSKEMVEAFSHAPHPRGTVIAADVFSSGVLLSDTDFGQFEKYLNVSGLDFAIVGHSYFYHTQKDRLEFVETGASQHFASNVMAILDHLLSPASPLLSDKPFSPPDMVYFSLYDIVFFSWSSEAGRKAYIAIATVVVALTATRIDWTKWSVFGVALLATPLGLITGIVSGNVIAGILFLLGKKMTWFKHEHLCILLFAPAAFAGQFTMQYLLAGRVAVKHRHLLEHAHFYAQLVFSTLIMLLLQAVGIRSAYIYAIISGTLLVGVIGNEVTSKTIRTVGFGWGYLATLPLFVLVAVEAVTTTLDIFTPLTGRIGKDAPAEFIIATIASSTGLMFFPPLSPMFHRLTRAGQRRTILSLFVISLSVMAVLASPYWTVYDSMHPKRAAVQYTYNHTTSALTANVAFMDSGPEFDFVEAIHERYGTDSPVEETIMNKFNPDWDVLYPVSSFLDTYRFELPPNDFVWPQAGFQVQDTPGDGTRKLDLRLNFTGIVWPILAFNAEIDDWSFDFPPPAGHRRHHIKMATGADTPIVDLSLTIKSAPEDKMSIHWVGIDLNQMVPGTASQMGPDMPGSIMLMDLQEWAKEKYNDSLEILTYAAVSGIVDV